MSKKFTAKVALELSIKQWEGMNSTMPISKSKWIYDNLDTLAEYGISEMKHSASKCFLCWYANTKAMKSKRTHVLTCIYCPSPTWSKKSKMLKKLGKEQPLYNVVPCCSDYISPSPFNRSTREGNSSYMVEFLKSELKRW